MTHDGFDAWMAEQGEPPTTMVDGLEVVDKPVVGIVHEPADVERMLTGGNQ